MTEIRKLGDRYELGESIGRGGMAEVFESRDTRLGRRVAIKILRPDLAKDPTFQSRFRREAQSAASLNDPNIVAIYDTGEDTLEEYGHSTVVPYIVMEFVDGQTLRQILGSGRRLMPERALEITAGILAALDYSHRHGIVHRDIKPANIMLNRAGDVKVMDFGIARAIADSTATMTAASAVMGTAQYLSPEQARGEVVDARSDLYSTGCLLYELLTGRPPFTGDSPVSVAYQHVSENPTPPSQVDSGVPVALDPLVMKALAKDPDHRYQTASDFRSDVERAIAGMPVTSAVPVTDATTVITGVGAADAATRPTGTPVPLADETKTSPWKWIGITAAVLLVAGMALFLGRILFGNSPEQVTVPQVTGQTIAVAETKLANVGLKLGTTTPTPSDQPKGQILSQDPTSGTMLAKGQGVNVTVSSGKEQVTVPQLTGLSSTDDARLALSDAQLQLGSVKQQESDQPEGTVLSQNPQAGTSVDAGTRVNIAVSNGQVSVPDVVGKSRAQAASTLQQAGFQVQVLEQEDGSVSPGTVLAQAPIGGNKARKGSTVTITVATAPPPSPSPTATKSGSANGGGSSNPPVAATPSS